jgi:phage terminase Nu1 subunit (DNA packaging protein)
MASMPYAVSAKSLARMFDLSTRTIQRWDQQGMLTRLQAPSAGDGRGALVRYVVGDFIRFLQAQPRSREGRFKERRFVSMGDALR